MTTAERDLAIGTKLMGWAHVDPETAGWARDPRPLPYVFIRDGRCMIGWDRTNWEPWSPITNHVHALEVITVTMNNK